MRNLTILTLVLLLSTIQHIDARAQTRRRGTTTSRTATRSRTPPSAKAGRRPTGAQPSAAAASLAAASAVTTASGLTCIITRKGTGRQPAAGETAIVHYTGTLSNGVKFDSSRDRGEPIAFKLGAGRVIKGWDEGVARLRVGDQAVLVIPPQLGYGAKGAGGGLIPPDSTLIFIVELMDVKATSLSEVLSQTLKERGIEAAVKRYQELKGGGLKDIYASESDMNGWGYRLLAEGRLREAIEIFKLNVDAYPKSANVYDSLAEAYAASGERRLAIENYNKALELDPQLESARKALKTLTGN